MAAYIDLSEKHGHRNDHGFACGAEFNVKIRRRINIPDFVREKLSQGEIDEIWWEEAGRSRDSLKDALSRRYKWIGELAFVGRGPGWLAIEDTGCRPRNWDTIGKLVDQHLKEFIKSMEASSFWRDIADVETAAAPAVSHSTRKTSGRKYIIEHFDRNGRFSGFEHTDKVNKAPWTAASAKERVRELKASGFKARVVSL